MYLSLAIIFTALAQISYKLYFHENKKIYLGASLGIFCSIPVMSYMALKGLGLSVVYMSTGLTYVLVMLLARMILKEAIDKQQIYAVLFIISGVVLYNI